MNYQFYADFSGEYYRFKEEDVLPDFTLSDSVPDFIKRLVDNGTLTAGFWRFGICQPKVLSYTWDENQVDDTVFPGDCIIQLSYFQRLGQDEVHIIPRRIFDELFHGDERDKKEPQKTNDV